MADGGKDQYVTRLELDLRLKNIEQASTRIETTVVTVAEDLKEFKGILNPAFITMKQQLANHIAQDQREEERRKERRKERWSPWQIVITAIAAAAAVGMFIVAIVK